MRRQWLVLGSVLLVAVVGGSGHVALALALIAIFVAMLLFGPLRYAAHVQWRTRAKDVRLKMTFFEINDVVGKGVLVFAPFYDESKHFSLDVYTRGIKLGFKPVDTMPEVVRHVLRNVHFVQVMSDSRPYPAAGHLAPAGERLTEFGVELLDGALVHSPDAIAKGSLLWGLSDGADLFYLCPRFDAVTRRAFGQRVDEWRRAPGHTFYQERECLAAVGLLFSKAEEWQLCHDDAAVVVGFANSVLAACVTKVFRLNDVQPVSSFSTPEVGRVFADFFTFSGQPNRLRMFLKGGQLVITREQGGRLERYVQTIPLGRD